MTTHTLDAKPYTDKNCDQCWTCQNRRGHINIDVKENQFSLSKSETLKLPFCIIMNLAMTVVYNRPCNSYKPL